MLLLTKQYLKETEKVLQLFKNKKEIWKLFYGDVLELSQLEQRLF